MQAKFNQNNMVTDSAPRPAKTNSPTTLFCDHFTRLHI